MGADIRPLPTTRTDAREISAVHSLVTPHRTRWIDSRPGSSRRARRKEPIKPRVDTAHGAQGQVLFSAPMSRAKCNESNPNPSRISSALSKFQRPMAVDDRQKSSCQDRRFKRLRMGSNGTMHECPAATLEPR